MAPRIILIACGSFSPPTPMHMRMFEIAKDHFLQLGTHDVIGGVMSPVHDAYEKKGLVAAKHRLAMVKLSLQSSDWIRLSDWECAQDQWTRTRNTLQYHQNYINNFLNDINGTVNEILPGWLPDGIRSRKDKVQIKLLCGADLLESFSVPGLWSDEDVEEIIGNHGIVVISRNGTNPEKFIFDSDILTKYRNNITIITNWVPNEVSSTMIRRLLGRGQSVKYLIDDLVIEYIKMQGLFDVNSTKYILTPNQNQFITNENFLNDQYINKINLENTNTLELEEMDETDFSSKKSLISVNLDNGRPKVFCCGNEALKVKSILGRPGQAVQVITDSPAPARNNNDELNEVGTTCDDDEDEVNDDDNKLANLKNNKQNNNNDKETKSFKIRDNDKKLLDVDRNYLEFIKKSIKENRIKSNDFPYR